jgi:hypothetical protein
MANDIATVPGTEVGEDGLVNLEEARCYLGNISRSSLYGMLRNKELQSVMLGKGRMVTRALRSRM